MNYYLSRNYKSLSTAGNKARTDIEKIMQEMGIKNIGLPTSTYSNTIIGFIFNLVSVIRAIALLRKGDNIVLQYPVKKYFSIICKAAHLHGAKVIVVIHDLGSFRRKKLTAEKEIKRLNNADYIICHNSHMEKWLIENGISTKTGQLGIFDFLSETAYKNSHKDKSTYSVVYAGRLGKDKNRFLYEIGEYIESYNIVLYGNGFEKEDAKGERHFIYKGFMNSDQLIKNAEGDFGLVWDGDSISECSGNFGEYLKLNNPHKTSLYIRCGLPIIIWEQAALADFVKLNNIGFTVGSLTDIEKIISNITEEEYSQLRNNINKISYNLSNGYYINKALNNAILSIS
jgi:hypothetical protein